MISDDTEINIMNQVWAVWIDNENKIIYFKETPNAVKVYFDSEKSGMEAVNKLVLKGYRIG